MNAHWWSFSVPCHCCLWLAQLGIFKWINQSVIPLISSTKRGCFSTKKQTLLLCFDWYCEAASMQSILWKALYKYTWLDIAIIFHNIIFFMFLIKLMQNKRHRSKAQTFTFTNDVFERKNRFDYTVLSHEQTVIQSTHRLDSANVV